MPTLNGPELLSKMKGANKYLRTILMTAFDAENAKFSHYIKREIIHAFFQKPVRLTHFIELVRTELHSYEIQKRISTER
jgi:DNA-binding NtrC family response regulator